LNPNEPNESVNGFANTGSETSEMRALQGMSSGIRSIKEMFKILKNEDKKRIEGNIEEEDTSNDEDNSPDKDSGSDSDPMEGELTGAE
jgi:hypothetical protein